MFGIRLLPNFDKPFLSENITNFWKRFHMSLSLWFNDYIFRQVSFRYRRWGIYASTLAVFVTWMLFGIWHGSGWTYMIIGLLQTIAINYEYFTKKLRIRIFGAMPRFFAKWLGRLFTYLFYCLSLSFFFSPDVKSAFAFLSNLVSIDGPSPFSDISIKPFQVLIYIPLILMIEYLHNDHPAHYSRLETYWVKESKGIRMLRWTLYSLMITIIYIAGFKSQQFVYANF